MATISHEQQLANPRYRDWVKAGLATKYVKEGIEVFIDEVCKRQHEDMLLDIRMQYIIAPTACNSCNLKTLMPMHSKGRNGCSLGQNPCNCLNVHRKTVCPTKFCSAMYDKIVLQHKFSAPNWTNTDITQWAKNHWEIAKCNIPGRGYKLKTCARETDCAGLLNIAINDMDVHRMIDCLVNPPNDVFSRTRAARDDIFHSPDMELDHTKMEAYIKDMIALLNDKYLSNRPEAIAATDKLKKLLNDDFRITETDESQVRKELLAAIEEKKLLAISAVENEGERQKKQIVEEKENILQELRTEQTKSSKETVEKLELMEKNVQEIEEKFSSIKENVLQSKIEDENRTQSDKLRVTRYNERKISLQTELITLYQEYLTKTYVLPMIQEEKCDVKDIYVDQSMFTGKKQKAKEPVEVDSLLDPVFRFEIEAKTSEPLSGLENDVTTYRSIFYKGEKKNKKIYLSGGAGMGKTTFCKNLISRWCDVHASKINASTADDDDDTMILRSFQLLFYVTLRHIKNKRHVHDMIKSQLLFDEQDIEIFEQILTTESEICLIILDGLDEWNPSDEEQPDILPQSPFQNRYIPQTNLKRKYTILTTTRSWKLEEVRLMSTDADIHVKLQGFSSSSADMFIQKVVKTLNKKFKRKKQYQEFRDELERQSIADLKSVPIALLQLICIWHDGKPLGTSLCDIYSTMINLLFEISKKPVSNTHQGNQQLPKCFNNKRKCRENSELLLKLSKLSFETLFPQDGKSALEFDRSEENVFGMSSEDFDICLQLGLLTVGNVLGKSASVRLTHLSFLHETFQEFLAAIHISNVEKCASNLQHDHMREALTGDCSTIAERVFISCNTLLGVLEMGRIFKFVSGLNPTQAKELSMGIHSVVEKIDTVQQYRVGEKNENYPSDLKQVQSLVFACITEMQNAHPLCGKTGTSLYLGDLIIDQQITNEYFDDFSNDKSDDSWGDFVRNEKDIKTIMLDQLPYLDMKGVRSVFISQTTPGSLSKDALEIISTCHSLQKLVVWIDGSSSCLQSNTITNRVFQMISQSCSSLISVSLGCKSSHLNVGYIENIPSVLSNLNYIYFEGIVSHHTNCEKIISLLQNSMKLRYLYLRDMACQNHQNCSLVKEFPACHQLQKLDLRRVWNIGLCDTNLKLSTDMKKLQYIALNDAKLTENGLLAFLNEITNIEHTLEVVLSNTEVTTDSFLFKEVKICRLRVIKQPRFTDKTSQTNTFIEIEHNSTTAREINFLYGHVIENSKLTPKLKCLDIQCRLENPGLSSDITSAVVTEVPKLLYLERLTLKGIDFGALELKLNAEMESLTHVGLDSCTITGRALKGFLRGIPMLKQTLRIEVNQTKIVENTAEDTIPLTTDGWRLATLKVIAQWFDNGENIEIESIRSSLF
ncbi:uncharacterized protein LOC123546419 [Mercenaria mercenaria]|uniref:uncharacterized protein LOC123546419 n=1 Tax=Mercenaria mercenaria TaxID=6596 RepID=UPI00234F4C96|nr:uncharacterized protein LOC123546419 [Mercenaria mercenaria]XP_045188604.2 uncharacterized protein LOC123546419 [Mercenaria mercenaria]XP_045188606.2 uncharacterized protein LOC123546419 [Mercenaria mercenaria]XP_045188607.2 uncharacterized protein LOC123546419 [Mercenaria mercenaria]